MTRGKPLLFTPGDPAGIGPEVVAASLDFPARRPRVIFGDRAALEAACAMRGVRAEVRWLDRPEEALGLPGAAIAGWDPGDGDEPVEAASVRAATRLCREGHAAGLVTGPIHKARLAARGFAFSGHTDFLGHLCGVARPVMAFTGGRLRLSLATVHVPLRRVAEVLTTDLVAHTIRVSERALREDLGLLRPRILVCGLNPHAGDGGVLGDEEITVIRPALQQIRAEGIEVEGPISAESAFRKAAAGGADWVVAMYHDQGLAPLKLIDFGESVNWTLGLPILRTSVDHGTADDIAGRGMADPRSWVAAWRLAEQLAERREAADPGAPASGL
jgi:4-hydroxythreonine-4-phosphate dehydrogenase